MDACIAVIGGSGLYQIEGLEDIKQQQIDTPFGRPSAPITSGQLHGTSMLFLPRHGAHHTILPSEINYRANIYALKSLGAVWCISVSAVGSLREELPPGTIVIPDQLIDRTYARKGTFFGEGLAAHIAFAEPFCPVLSDVLARCATTVAKRESFHVKRGGTYVCMEGPAFSSKAESHLHRSWGASLIGMTALPEAKLAREAEIAYATLALVTDYDCWKDDGDHVDVSKVVQIMQSNALHAKAIIGAAVQLLREREPSPLARNALINAFITPLQHASEEALKRLGPLVEKYCH